MLQIADVMQWFAFIILRMVMNMIVDGPLWKPRGKRVLGPGSVLEMSSTS